MLTGAGDPRVPDGNGHVERVPERARIAARHDDEPTAPVSLPPTAAPGDVSTDAVSTEAVSTEAVSTEAVPADEVRAEDAPADEAPVSPVVPVAADAGPAPAVTPEAVPVRVDPALQLVSHLSAMIALLILGFLTHLTLLSGLQHARDQGQAYAELRNDLAIGVAPVGAVDADGALLRLGAPVAIIEIRRIGLREVVVEGTSSRALMSGPGHRRDTVQPGQVGVSVVMGRRSAYGGPFSRLDEVRQGDEILVTTGQGPQTFSALGVRHAGDPLPPTLAQGKARLTLATADGAPFRPEDVLWVDADLTGQAQDPGTRVPPAALPAAEGVLAGDSSALLPLMLWLPLLLVSGGAIVWLRHRIGRARAWVIGVPVLLLFGLLASDEIAALLPNVL